MKKPTPRRPRPAPILLGLLLAAPAGGCFQEDNNREFLRNAPAAEPGDHPDETVAERKARTRRVSAAEKKVEARQAAALEKAKAKAAASPKRSP